MRIRKILATTLLLLAACTQDIHIDRITLDPQSLLMALEDTQQLTVRFLSGSPEDIEWLSSDQSIATVSPSGLVTSVEPGYATIYASNASKGLFARCEVFVRGYKWELVTGVELSKHDLTLYPSDSYRLSAVVSPETAINKNVRWSSSSSTVAWINKSGYLTALSPGTTVVTVTTDEGGFTDTCNVTVLASDVHVKSLVLPDVLHLSVGESSQLELVIEPEDATNKNVSWASLDESIATVTQEGVVTGIAPGSVHVKATAEDGGAKAYCLVTVSGESGD